MISGDALALDGGTASLTSDGDTASYGSVISSDTIHGGDGDDTISGDVLSVGGIAHINGAGDDSIDGGAGDDIIVGDALATAGGTIQLQNDEAVGSDNRYAGDGSEERRCRKRCVGTGG